MTEPGGPPGRARAAHATRTDLLTAAMRRFTVLGYERTTMRDVAADVGVNVSLINRYFGSKDGLFAAVMHESADTLEQLRTAAPAGLVATLLALEPEAWPEFGGEHPLLLLLGDIGADDRVRHLREESLALVVRWLAEQVGPEGSADAGDAELNAEIALALITGVLALRMTMPHGVLRTSDPAGVRTALRRAVGAILRTPPPGKAAPPD